MTKTIVDGITRDMTSEEKAIFDSHQLTAVEYAAKELDLVRVERNAKLAESDWTQMADSSLTDSVKAEWVTYRAALRDITDSATSLDDVTWPEKP